MVHTGKSVYGGDLTGGSLLVRESRVIAGLLINGISPANARGKVLDRNLFQNRSPATTRKYSSMIFSRLKCLTQEQLRMVAQGTKEVAAMILFIAVLKNYPIVRDFVAEVMVDKVKGYEPNLEKKDWRRFLEQRETIDPDIRKWTESSRNKIGQVLFRMLSEAGFISDTSKMTIQFPRIPPEVAESLSGSPDRRLLEYLKPGKGA